MTDIFHKAPDTRQRRWWRIPIPNQLKRQILMMEMDDTVGHSFNGPYFSRLHALKTELWDLEK